MTGWGLEGWGIDPWNGFSDEAPPGESAPTIILLNPTNGARDVAPDVVVGLQVTDQDGDLDPASVAIFVNEVPAYNGVLGFFPGFTGVVKNIPFGVVIQIQPISRWQFDQEIVFRVTAQDLGGRQSSETFRFAIQANPDCYTGLTPLPIEELVKLPATEIVPAETVRRALFDSVLRVSSTQSISNFNNKAARAITQIAYATELRTLLNQRVRVTPEALAVNVCEKERSIIIDRLISPVYPQVKEMSQLLFERGVIPQFYVSTINDYLNSNKYPYRVSVAATLVMLTRAWEPTVPQ